MPALTGILCSIANACVASAGGDVHGAATGHAASAIEGANAFERAAHAARQIVDATPAPDLSYAGWILWLPAIAALLCGVCAIFRVKGKLPAWITVGCLAGAAVIVFKLYATVDRPVTIHLFDWIDVRWGEGPRSALAANFTLYIDSLSLFWMLFVVPLGTLIALYASEYMATDLPSAGGRGYARFFAGIGIFLFAMSCLVMGGNLIMLYLGWEGVGFASYMLVGYYYKKPSAVAAAKKAFIMNRIGDLGLALGIYCIWVNYGSLEYDVLWKALAGAPTGDAAGATWSVQAIPFLLMLGAFGKSAQVPLYVWLPDAMEGPTPVSALIHAATMVTAGVYLIARMFPFFLLHDAALPTVAWVGGISALLAATIGMAQYDIKRVMAYSTISQLGYMFMGLGVATTFGASFHVFTHAFFKAVLFLTCGAIMHGFAGQLDLRKVSGLIHVPGWRIVAWTMFIGCLCLSGVPLTSGFFSKDEIIGHEFNVHSVALGLLALFTAGLTAYYAFRVWFRVCAGPVHYEPGDELGHGADEDDAGAHGHDGHAGHAGHAETKHAAPAAHAALAHDHGDFHPHAPGWAINFVILVIAIGALVVAYFPGGNWVRGMIEHSSAAAGVPPESHGTLFGIDRHMAMYCISGTFAAVGIFIAWWLHLHRRKSADDLRAALLANPVTRWLPTAMENKWYVDELYIATVRAPLWMLGHLFGFLDKYLVDGLLVDGTARIPRVLGRLFQPLQNGVLQGYAVTMAGGVGLIIAWLVVLPWVRDWLAAM